MGNVFVMGGLFTLLFIAIAVIIYIIYKFVFKKLKLWSRIKSLIKKYIIAPAAGKLKNMISKISRAFASYRARFYEKHPKLTSGSKRKKNSNYVDTVERGFFRGLINDSAKKHKAKPPRWSSLKSEKEKTRYHYGVFYLKCIRKGYSYNESHTPYEQLSDVQKWDDSYSDKAADITESYVKARYDK